MFGFAPLRTPAADTKSLPGTGRPAALWVVAGVLAALPLAGLDIVEVSAPAINCVFDVDCRVTVSDSTSPLALMGTSGQGFVQSRVWPPGQRGTTGQGLTAYLYRVDLSGVDQDPLEAPACINNLVLRNVGPHVPLDFDGDGAKEDLFVVTGGGIGTVGLGGALRAGAHLVVGFRPALCPGQSTFFLGLASEGSASEGEAALGVTNGSSPVVPIRRPEIRLERGELMAAAADLAAFLETHRRLPSEVEVGGFSLSSAQFLFAAIEHLRTPAGTTATVRAGSAADPASPYPTITLVPEFQLTPWTSDQYPSVLGELAAQLPDSGAAPDTFQVDGHAVRFPEALYYAASLVRALEFFDEWPERLDKSIIAPQGLGGWTAPDALSEYTSVLTSTSASFQQANRSRSYYAMPAHRPEAFLQAREIVGGATDRQAAAQSIFTWVIQRWLNDVLYTSGQAQFEGPGSANMAELAKHFGFTSGFPRWPMSLYLRALGIPSSPSGAVWFAGSGWVNMENHRSFGSDLTQNPFYYDSPTQPDTKNAPPPSVAHDVHPRVQAIRQQGGAALTGTKAVFLNPSDVLEHGADFVVERSLEAGFDTLILTVKSARGFLYYPTAEASRFRGDALGPLVAAAHNSGLEVWAAFSTLADRQTGSEHPEWTQRLHAKTDSGGNFHPNLFLSPCVPEYRSELAARMTELAASHPIDGVLLTHHYFAQLPSYPSDDTVGHSSCPTSPQAWPEGQITQLAQSLFAEARQQRPTITTAVAAPPLGTENRYTGLSSGELGHQDLAGLAALSDHLLLVVLGDYWVPSTSPYWVQAIQDATALTGSAPLVSFYFSDDWTYPVSFYQGLTRWVQSEGVAGISFHSALSAQGELGPAFREGRWFKLSGLALP